MSKIIEKKILPEYFNKILLGEKTYELRLADWECNQVIHRVVGGS